jgi:hypothetical protein
MLVDENLHTVVPESSLILLENKRGKKFWQIIIKQELT